MSSNVRALEKCRICGGGELAPVLDLGVQALTGVFPRRAADPITKGPLILVKCVKPGGCGLLQLAHSYDLEEMYGENYGYRSGLNASMVAHLKSKVRRIEDYGLIHAGTIVLDIGANDGTTLGLYARDDVRLVGIDPTAAKFREHYKPNITIVPEFFSAERFWEAMGPEAKAGVVTSFSMFYDMDDPIAFMSEVAEVLDDRGIWVCEQSYMPLMLETNSYDTVCHEHLEYYALEQILWMAERAGLEVVDAELNDVNGGSFSFVAQKARGPLNRSAALDALCAREDTYNLGKLATYEAFAQRVEDHRDALLDFLRSAKANGRRVVGLGASTKGNVLLQYCGITTDLIEAIGEVNADKFGKVTPGSNIPIVDEAPLLATKPDFALVLPWHFRRFFETQSRYRDVRLVFPLPTLIVAA